MDKDQLAALDRAAREPTLEGSRAADDLAAKLFYLYRTGKLVLIGPDAVEVVARAMMAHVGLEWVDGPEEERSLLNKHEARALATAALAALGVK